MKKGKKCLYGGCLQEDRISSLSDDVLVIILSFLSFKEVIRTCILSRRWLNLWVHTLVLDFHVPLKKKNDMRHQNFIEWANYAIRRLECPYIKEFKIDCRLDKVNAKDVESWLNFVSSRKVDRLELNLGCSADQPKKFSRKYLLLSQFIDTNSKKAISDGNKSLFLRSDFKSLKSLSLKKVDVTGEAINILLVNCPILEQLEVAWTTKLVELVISDPNLALKHLKIKNCMYLKVLHISNLNLVSLEMCSVDDLTLTNLPMLVELSINGMSERLSHSFSKASSCFSQLEAFTLSVFCLEDASLVCNTDKFTKLKRLVIEVTYHGNSGLTKLISIINSCPQLEEVVLQMSLYYSICESLEWIVSRENVSLRSKSLKVFEFIGYNGSACEVNLIKDMVDYAVCLEKMIVQLNPPRDIRTRTEEAKAREIAMQQIDAIKMSIPPHVDLLIR